MMNYLSLEEVIVIHDKMLEVGEGREGIRDFGLLKFVLAIENKSLSLKETASWLKKYSQKNEMQA